MYTREIITALGLLVTLSGLLIAAVAPVGAWVLAPEPEEEPHHRAGGAVPLPLSGEARGGCEPEERRLCG